MPTPAQPRSTPASGRSSAVCTERKRSSANSSDIIPRNPTPPATWGAIPQPLRRIVIHTSPARPTASRISSRRSHAGEMGVVPCKAFSNATPQISTPGKRSATGVRKKSPVSRLSAAAVVTPITTMRPLSFSATPGLPSSRSEAGMVVMLPGLPTQRNGAKPYLSMGIERFFTRTMSGERLTSPRFASS